MKVSDFGGSALIYIYEARYLRYLRYFLRYFFVRCDIFWGVAIFFGALRYFFTFSDIRVFCDVKCFFFLTLNSFCFFCGQY